MLHDKKTGSILFLFLVLLFPAVLSGCGQEEKDVRVFHARILEIREGTMLVEPDQGSEEARSSDVFW